MTNLISKIIIIFIICVLSLSFICFIVNEPIVLIYSIPFIFIWALGVFFKNEKIEIDKIISYINIKGQQDVLKNIKKENNFLKQMQQKRLFFKALGEIKIQKAKKYLQEIGRYDDEVIDLL